jgi:hypothetical protein
MSGREIVEYLLSFLREEQRTIPHASTDFDDPIPHAVRAVNATLQTLAVASPLFAVKRPKSAWFHASESVAVTGVTVGDKVASCTAWPSWAAGCKIQLPGDGDYNRIVSVSGTVATLQFPHQGDTSGTATLYGDVATLDDDVITVLDPVRTRGGVDLRPASGPGNLTMPSAVDRVDFGRIMRVTPLSVGRNSYFVDSVADEGDSQVRLRMMLNSAPSEDLIVGFNARCALGRLTEDMVYGEKYRFASILSASSTTNFLTPNITADENVIQNQAQVGDVIIPYTEDGGSFATSIPMADGGVYYIQSITGFEFKVTTTPGGAVLDITQDSDFLADLYLSSATTTQFPIPNEFLETLFLPLATVKFLSSPAMQNFDVGGTTNARALELAQAQSEQGFAMLAKMNPQAQKSFRMWPGLG